LAITEQVVVKRGGGADHFRAIEDVRDNLLLKPSRVLL